MESFILKKDINELICRRETDSNPLKKNMVTKGDSGGGGWEGWTRGFGLAYAH